MSTVRRIAIIGPARSGKDTVAQWLVKNAGHTMTQSTSLAAAPIVVRHWNIDHSNRYAPSWPRVFWMETAKTNRRYWAGIIAAYNWSDGSGCRLYREIIAAGNTLLCGIRRQEELDACLAEGLVEDVIRVYGGEPDPTWELENPSGEYWAVYNYEKSPELLDRRMAYLLNVMYGQEDD